MYRHNPIHLRKSQYSWLQQVLITETNSSKLDTTCNSCYCGSRKCMGTTPFTLENHSTAGCNKFSSPRQILPNWIRCVIAVLLLSNLKCYGHNPIHLRKSQYSWLQQILITKTNSSRLDMTSNSCIMALESV